VRRRDVCVAALLLGCHARHDTLQVSGTVEIRALQLAPLTSGRLTRLLKDEGDRVHRGDTIAVLEQPGLDALINQRRAQAHAAAQRVGRRHRPARGDARGAQ
jgi:HlyD family secretion protein